MSAQAAQVFRAAYRILEVPGVWAQGFQEASKRGRSCLVFAVGTALRRRRANWSRERSTFAVLRKLSGSSSPASWNDTHTLPEVLSLLERAALAAESEAG